MDDFMNGSALSIILFIVSTAIFILFGMFLHKQRKQSTKAKDFFQKIEVDAIETHTEMNEEEIVTKVLEPKAVQDDANPTLLSEKDIQRKTYRELVELFKNRVLVQKTQVDNQTSDTDETITLDEFAYICGLDIEDIENIFLRLGLLERHNSVLLLTNKGMVESGEYVRENGQVYIKWKKENLLKIIHLNENEETDDEDTGIFTEVKPKRNSLDTFWDMFYGVIFWAIILYFIFGR